MNQSELSQGAPPEWGMGDFTSFIQGLSPGVAVIVTLALLAVAAWIGLRALPLLRAMRAIKTAPLVKVASAEPGVVKVAGVAHPGQETPAGFSAPDHVWQRTFRLSSTSVNAGSRTYSVGLMLLRDESGECLVDPRHARVFHSRIDSGSGHFLDSFKIDTSYRIDTGDPVFAIGLLGTAKTRPGHGDLPRCTLRPTRTGVLIYSGQSEARTLLRMQARFWPLAGVAFLLALVTVWGLRTQMLTYATDADFLRTLVTDPWASIWERHPELLAPTEPGEGQ